MSHNTFDQCNDLVTRIAADGTVAEDLSLEILNTELAREVLAAIVGGQDYVGTNTHPGALFDDT